MNQIHYIILASCFPRHVFFSSWNPRQSMVQQFTKDGKLPEGTNVNGRLRAALDFFQG